MTVTMRRSRRDRESPAHPGSRGTRLAGPALPIVDSVTSSNPLGEYPRAPRGLVDPADVGLRVTGVRRTPGLRREEVATLAGISADYYLRLEQGRDRHPSAPGLPAPPPRGSCPPGPGSSTSPGPRPPTCSASPSPSLPGHVARRAARCPRAS